MTCWVIQNGVPFDVAHCLSEEELLAYSVVFAQHDNGNKIWDWDNWRFLDR